MLSGFHCKCSARVDEVVLLSLTALWCSFNLRPRVAGDCSSEVCDRRKNDIFQKKTSIGYKTQMKNLAMCLGLRHTGN